MSAMVAYPTNGLSSNAGLYLSTVDAASLNGQSSGCHSQTDDNGERSRSSSPISLGAFSNYIPKNGGQLIRNRIFVCGFGNNTAEDELRAFFEQYGNVKDVKVIADKSGSSKGYGFVTFESEEEAKRIIKEEQNNNKLNFKDRTLNIGPAVKREVARNNSLAHVLAAASVPELTTGPALYYQSPGALAQVLLPGYNTLTQGNMSLAVDSSNPYAAYAAQTPVQYALLGNQFVNYTTTPIYAPSPSQFIDSKYVAGAINGTLNNGDCYSTATSMAGQSSTAQAAAAYASAYGAFPQASLSALYAASAAIPPNDMMYYGRNTMQQSAGPYQASAATSASSLSSSVDSTYPMTAEQQQQMASLVANGMTDCSQLQGANVNQLGGPYHQIAKLNGNEPDSDLSQSLSTMSLGNNNGAHDVHQSAANNANATENADYSAMYQQTYAPQMYNSIELAAAAAAAAWYQQNIQHYMAKSIGSMNPNVSGYVKAANQQSNSNNQQQQHHQQQPVQQQQQQMLAAAAAYAAKANGSLRQNGYK